MPHPTTHIRHRGLEADVDERLAALVLALWEAGIETASACQDEAESDAEVGGVAAADHRGRAYVEFVALHDALRFYDLVAASGPSAALAERMANVGTRGAWEARVAFYDTRVTSGAGDLSGRPSHAAGVVRVRFPAADIDEITSLLAPVR